MGTGYTRNDTANNIADGNVINAADFDGEYDAIESAFNATSGHTHDGTAGEGAPVTVLGPVQDFVASSTEVKPKTDNTLDIGTSALQFKDMYLNGKAYIDGLGETLLVDTDKAIQFRDSALSINSSTDGQLDIDADTEIEITTALVEISADATVGDDLTLKSDAAVLGFGADTDVTLTHVADTGLLLNDAMVVQFRDNAINIGSPADGDLDINADSEIELNSTLIDINGNVEISGTAAITGIATFTDDIIIGDGKTIGSTSDVDAITIAADGQLTLTQQLNGTAGTFSGILKTDDTTDATSTTDGSLQTDGGLSVVKDAVFGNDIKLLSDSAILSLGADSEVTLTHEHNAGIQAKAADGFNLNLQTGHTSIEAADVIGKITFNAPNEAASGDALLDGAAIEALAEATFSSSVNSTALVFKTNTSDSAVERMRIKSDGVIQLGGSGANVTVTTNGTGDLTLNTNSGTNSGVITIADGAAGAITIDPDGAGNIDLTTASGGETNITKVDIDDGAIDGVTLGTNSPVTELQVDNINVNGNAITSTDTNGNIALTPNGTGDVQLDADTVRVGDSNANATITTNGTGDLILNTNAGTDSGSITIADAANGAITIAPNGTGNVAVGNFTFDADQTVGASQDNMVLTFDNSGGTIQLEAIPAPSIGGNLASALSSNGFNFELGDSGGATDDRIRFGDGNDLEMYWDGTDGHISIASSTLNIDGSGETLAKFIDDGAVELYHNDTKTFETVAAGVQVTGRATSASITAENDGSFDLSANNNFSCTTAGNTELTFSNIAAGQSGNIKLVVGSGHAITANAVVGINSSALTALQTAGTYNLSYYAVGTSGTSDVLVSVSGALTSQGA